MANINRYAFVEFRHTKLILVGIEPKKIIEETKESPIHSLMRPGRVNHFTM